MEKLPQVSKEAELVARIRNGELRGKKALEQLAATKEFLFHGSPVFLEELEPRQSYNAGKPDGDPGISAAPDEGYELAIFMSLMKSGEFQKDRPKGSRRSGFATSDARDGRWDFTANKLAFEDAISPDAVGYVHVFKKQDFKQHEDREYEWRTNRNIKPLLVVKVTAEDLPQDIKIIEEGE